MSDKYRAFVERTLKSVEQVGESFTEPDDDWAPVLLIQSHDGPGAVYQFESRWLADKDGMAAAIADLLREHRAERCALVLSAWQAEVDASEWDERPAGLQPNRREIVSVTVMDRERVEGHNAEILRTDDAPPTLGPWSALMPEQTQAAGRFIEAMQPALL